MKKTFLFAILLLAFLASAPVISRANSVANANVDVGKITSTSIENLFADTAANSVLLSSGEGLMLGDTVIAIAEVNEVSDSGVNVNGMYVITENSKEGLNVQVAGLNEDNTNEAGMIWNECSSVEVTGVGKSVVATMSSTNMTASTHTNTGTSNPMALFQEQLE